MSNYDVYFPSYTIGENAYEALGSICSASGSMAVVIGGKRAMAAAKQALSEAALNGGLQILDFIWYGGECSFENVEILKSNESVLSADMIFAVGGGKAIDTCKAVGHELGKPVYTFPTISSNCAACTSVSIMYTKEGVFLRQYFFDKPPAHTFIHLGIIAASPERYMWAGMGDTYAKYFESSVSSRGENLKHYVRLGVNTSVLCVDPILEYGAEAMQDAAASKVTRAFEETVLSIVVTTGIASILLTKDHIIDYNTGLAHAIFYTLTAYPQIEKDHLHGEVVSFGVLVLLLVDGQQEMFEKLHAFSRSVGLPVSLQDVDIPESEEDSVIDKVLEAKDIKHYPYVVTRSMMERAFAALKSYNETH